MNRVAKFKIVACVATGAMNLFGQATNEVQRLEPIKVTAMLKEQELKDVPLSVSVIDRQAIERSSAATTADLLADIPGVELFDGGMSGMKRVAIRGEGDRTLVLVDGLAISEQKAMSGAPILVSPDEIERIEVVKGPGSVLYGSEAIGGVINIITKKGAEQKTSLGIDASYDTAQNGGQVAGRASYAEGNSRVYVSAARSDYDNLDSADGEVDNTSWNSTTLGAGIAHETDSTSAGLNFSWFKGEYDVHTGSPDMMMTLPSWERTRFNGYFEKRDISERFAKFRADAYFQRTEKEFINDIDWASTMGMSTLGSWDEYKDTHNTQNTFGLKVQTDWILGDNHYVIAGLDLVGDYLKSDDYTRTSTSGMLSYWIPSSESMYSPEASRWSGAIFVQDEWSFADNWSLVLGYRGTAAMTDNEADAGSGTESSDDTSLNGTASLALVNTTFDDITLRAVLSQGYRLPTLGELYTTSGMAGQYITGNPDLEEETSTSAELGMRYFGEQLTVDAAVFYTTAENYIDSVEDATAATGWVYENMDEATTYGAELFVKYNLSESIDTELAPYLNLTVMRREYMNDGDATWNTGYPTISGRVGVRAETPIQPGMTGWVDTYVRAAGEAENEGTDEDPGWATWNLMVGVNYAPDESTFYENLRCQVGVLNILDKDYMEARNQIAAPERGLYLSVGLDF